MPRPFSSGQRRLICLLEVNHAFLAGSMIELCEEIECYLSFSNEDVFEGVTLPEETPTISPEEVTPRAPSQHQPASL